MKCMTIMIAVVLLAVSVVSAQPPQTISYQGALLDELGHHFGDGTYEMTFSLYDDETAGTLLWQETQMVSVSNSVFNVQLGSLTPFSTLAFDAPYWLAIELLGETLAPRIALASAPYSLNVADGKVVKSLNTLTDHVTLAAGANISITPSGSTLTVSSTGGTGDGHSLDAADGSPTDVVYVDNEGDVGIATSPAGYALTLGSGARNEAMKIEGAFNKNTTLLIDGGTSARVDLKHTSWDNPAHWAIISGGGDSESRKYLHFNNDGTDKLVISNAGDLGVGTSMPAAKLDVAGRAIFSSLGQQVINGSSGTSYSFNIGNSQCGVLFAWASGGGNINYHAQLYCVASCATGITLDPLSNIEDTTFITGVTGTPLGGPSWEHNIIFTLNGAQDDFNVYWVRFQ